MECYREETATAWMPDTKIVRQAADSGQSSDLSVLWGRLAAGELAIVTSFCTEERCYVCLSRGRRHKRGRQFLTKRNMEVLRRILLGDPQKAVALDLDLAASTVSLIASRCLEAVGVRSCIAKVPLLMVAAAHADSGTAVLFDARQTELIVDNGSLLVVSFRRPDIRLNRLLSSSRCQVARLRVEGFTHREIAVLRGTSPRTVANQLSATFRQLSVSGRIELLRRLIRDEAAGMKPPSRRFVGRRGPAQSRGGGLDEHARRTGVPSEPPRSVLLA
jgi:DNA-binding NarL/FixJ family response regulator